jgi:hypothetical protein
MTKKPKAESELLRKLASDDPGDRLEAVGRLLYGARWKEPMAVPLGVARNTVFNWASKPSSIPENIDGKLLEALERGAAIHREIQARTAAEHDAALALLRRRVGMK